MDMKCLKCKSEWVSTVSTLKSCPFCGAALNGDSSDDENKVFNSSSEALAFICKKHGVEILLGNKLSAYLADYAPDLPDGVKRIIRIFFEAGAADILKKSLNGSYDDRIEAVKRAQLRLTDNYISAEMAESVAHEFAAALGWEAVTAGSADQEDVLELLDRGKTCYESGDYTEAVKWYRKAAERGNSEAQYHLGWCYDCEYGVDRDAAAAAKWYRRAAEQGNNNAQWALGNSYYLGDGVTQNYDEAAKWYRKSAEQGNSAAQWKLGDCYYYGDGVKQDFDKAVKWYGRSAIQGNSENQLRLGDIYYKGNIVEQDYNEAVKWYRLSAKQGDSEAQYKLGDCYYYGRGVRLDKDKAAIWYRKSAEQGDSDAQWKLGDYFDKEKENYREAAKWYRMSAEQDNSNAQCALGNLYYFGDGVKEDHKEAEKWFRKSAKQGNSEAEAMLIIEAMDLKL